MTSAGEVLRIAVVAVVCVLLGRAARAAWERRRLAVAIWRAIRPRHVAGAVALIAVVLTTAATLLWLVPISGYGLGSLIGLEGNAVFAPIDGALEAPLEQADPGSGSSSAAADGGVPLADVVLVVGFLGGLVLLFPHLAHAEEVAFRTGWEDHDRGRQVLSALRFGLLHLVMLIPVAAAVAIAVAGFAYGQAYRRGYARAAVPRPVHRPGRLPLAEDADGYTRLVMGPPAPVLEVDRAAARRAGAFDAAVWHTTTNTVIALLVLTGYLLAL